MVIGFFLMGIEELAIQLEEPFSVLPLARIASGIGLDAEDAVQWCVEDIDSQASGKKSSVAEETTSWCVKEMDSQAGEKENSVA
jgi:predicted membrane chloride channel (bestrophin family)